MSCLRVGGDGGGSKALTNSATTSSEIKFGKHLASSDKRIRDRTVAALREWLRQRSRGGSLTDLDLLKVGWLHNPAPACIQSPTALVTPPTPVLA